MGPGPKHDYPKLIREYLDAQEASFDGIVSMDEASKVLKVTLVTLSQWNVTGKLSKPGTGRVDLRKTLELIEKRIAMGRDSSFGGESTRAYETKPYEGGRVEKMVEAEKIPHVPSQEARDILQIYNGRAPYRTRMLEAARQAARDVCLEVADERKVRGDHEGAAEALFDFIHAEEGLKMIFEERKV